MPTTTCGAAASTRRLWLALAGVVGGLVGLVVVRGIRRPLDATVQQAQALIDGGFVTVREPRMPELARLTRAMNLMVTRLKSLFDSQAAQVEALRRQAHHDPLTQLANRRHFLRQLDAALDREDGPAMGGIVLLRLRDLAEMNRLHGHEVADRAILAIAQALQVYPQQAAGCFVGRLNGSDFALCLPAAGVAREPRSRWPRRCRSPCRRSAPASASPSARARSGAASSARAVHERGRRRAGAGREPRRLRRASQRRTRRPGRGARREHLAWRS